MGKSHQCFLSDRRDKALNEAKLWGMEQREKRALNEQPEEPVDQHHGLHVFTASHNQLQSEKVLTSAPSYIHTDSGPTGQLYTACPGYRPAHLFLSEDTKTPGLTERSCSGRCDYITLTFSLWRMS